MQRKVEIAWVSIKCSTTSNTNIQPRYTTLGSAKLVRLTKRDRHISSTAFPTWYSASASPKHLPFSLLKWRTYASLRLNVFLHPPIMNIPLCSYMFSSSMDAPGTPHSSASMTGTPQHTQDVSSSARVCVAMCRFRSGERRLRCTCEQYGHFHRFAAVVSASYGDVGVGVELEEPRVPVGEDAGTRTRTLRRLLTLRWGRDCDGSGEGEREYEEWIGDRECEEWTGEEDGPAEYTSPEWCGETC